MAQKLSVLLINTQMEAAGAQKAMLELARGLKQRSHEVTVVTMYDKDAYVPLFEERYGLEIVNLELKQPGARSPLVNGWRFVRGLARLYGLMFACRPQIVQTFTHYSNILGMFIAWLARVPVRISSQRNPLKGYPVWLLRLDRVVANSFLTHKMVAVSEGTRRFSIEEEGIRPDKLVTIHNGINLERFSIDLPPEAERKLRQEIGLERDSLIILTVARLHPQKGHKYLIEAIPHIVRDFPRARFLFVGDGELKEELTGQVEQAGLSDFVRFLGVREDVPQLLAISDLFVLPSLWEGLSNAVLEAMAAGVPVIASNVEGAPELIVHEKTGLLVSPADANALKQSVQHLLINESLRTSIAEASKESVERKFSQDANVVAFIDLYEGIIADRINVS
jgi:glycosyltransferase involved in cell wall biosynthesis